MVSVCVGNIGNVGDKLGVRVAILVTVTVSLVTLKVRELYVVVPVMLPLVVAPRMLFELP